VVPVRKTQNPCESDVRRGFCEIIGGI